MDLAKSISNSDVMMMMSGSSDAKCFPTEKMFNVATKLFLDGKLPHVEDADDSFAELCRTARDVESVGTQT